MVISSTRASRDLLEGLAQLGVADPRAAANLGPVTVAPWRRRQPKILLALDALAAAIASVLAITLRFDSPTDGYVATAVLFPLAWVSSVGLSRAYETRYLGSGSEELRRVGFGALNLFAAVTAVAFAARLDPARGYVFTAFPVALGLTVAGRLSVRAKIKSGRRAGRWQHRVVAVGSERSVSDLITQMRREPGAGLVVVGACVDDAQSALVNGVPVLGAEADAALVLNSVDADTVAVTAWSRLGQSRLRSLSWSLEGSGVDLVVAPSLADVTGPRVHIRPVAGLPLLHVEQPEFTGVRRLAKGAMDRLGALLGLLLLSPLLIGIGLAVALSTRGPAVFRQVRSGANGSSFTMWKFRSMYVDAEARRAELAHANEASEGVLFKIKDDPRVTKVGRLLRRTSLDELPQLVNVLRGQMSLVGPRPPLPDEVAGYADHVHRRLLVKPGLTGLWQVSGRSDLTWEESVQLDLHYVENWTFLLDLQILCRTVLAVLSNRGAY